MQTREQMNGRVADLDWLAFLLTGNREASVDVAIRVLDLPDDTNPFFSTWRRTWSRRVVIAKALAALRHELAASATRTRSKHARKSALPPRNWTLDRDTAKVELERALLAAGAIPRCALLLSVFEERSLEDTAILLDADSDLIQQAEMAGLHELTGKSCQAAGLDIHRGRFIRRTVGYGVRRVDATGARCRLGNYNIAARATGWTRPQLPENRIVLNVAER